MHNLLAIDEIARGDGPWCATARTGAGRSSPEPRIDVVAPKEAFACRAGADAIALLKRFTRDGAKCAISTRVWRSNLGPCCGYIFDTVSVELPGPTAPYAGALVAVAVTLAISEVLHGSVGPHDGGLVATAMTLAFLVVELAPIGPYDSGLVASAVKLAVLVVVLASIMYDGGLVATAVTLAVLVVVLASIPMYDGGLVAVAVEHAASEVPLGSIGPYDGAHSAVGARTEFFAHAQRYEFALESASASVRARTHSHSCCECTKVTPIL